MVILRATSETHPLNKYPSIFNSDKNVKANQGIGNGHHSENTEAKNLCGTLSYQFFKDKIQKGDFKKWGKNKCCRTLSKVSKVREQKERMNQFQE